MSRNHHKQTSLAQAPRDPPFCTDNVTQTWKQIYVTCVFELNHFCYVWIFLFSKTSPWEESIKDYNYILLIYLGSHGLQKIEKTFLHSKVSLSILLTLASRHDGIYQLCT